jgi:hypothetical protein
MAIHADLRLRLLDLERIRTGAKRQGLLVTGDAIRGADDTGLQRDSVCGAAE